MAVLVNYRCTGCGAVSEHWTDERPSALACPQCGDEARRMFGIALVGKAVAAAPTGPSPAAFDCFMPAHSHTRAPSGGHTHAH